MTKTAQDAAFTHPNVQPVFIEGGAQAAQAGVVAPFGGNPAATTAATDYSFKWGSTGTEQVNHVLLQNNTAATINYDIDEAASAGSIALAAGATIFLDIQMSTLHLFTAGVVNVNGTATGNIVVRAWL